MYKQKVYDKWKQCKVILIWAIPLCYNTVASLLQSKNTTIGW